MSLSKKEKENIMQYLEERDKEGILNFIDYLFDKFRKKNVSVGSVQVIAAELIRIAIYFCMKYSLEDLREELMEIQLLRDYANKKCAELCKLMKQTFEKLMQEYDLHERGGKNYHVVKAMQYINSHYRKDISLTETAEYVGISAQYLSRLIKDEYKKGFKEILNGKRVEIACEMICSHNYKVKEIAEKAGFNNYNYFFKVFKDATGLTPVEYDRQKVYKQSLDRN
jgi:two-component system response regulator YesN